MAFTTLQDNLNVLNLKARPSAEDEGLSKYDRSSDAEHTLSKNLNLHKSENFPSQSNEFSGRVEGQSKKMPESYENSGKYKLDSEIESVRVAQTKSSLTESPNLYKDYGDSVSKIPYVFFPIPPEMLIDDFIEDPIMMRFIRWMFNRISPQPSSWKNPRNGQVIDLEPFEFVFGRLKCAEEARITEKQVQNRMNRLLVSKVVSKVVSKSVSSFSVYRLVTTGFKQITGQQVGQQVGQQTGHKLEERTKILDLKGTTNNVVAKSPSVHSPISPLSLGKKKTQTQAAPSESYPDLTAQEEEAKIPEQQIIEDIIIAEEFVKTHRISLKTKEIERWIRKWGGWRVMSTFALMIKQKNTVDKPGAWMEKALKEDWARIKENEPKNRKFAEDFKSKKNWTDLIILKKYCTIDRMGYDLQYSFDPETFKEILESKYENLSRVHSGEPNY